MALTTSQLDYIAAQIADACYDERPGEVLERNLDREWQIPGIRGLDYPARSGPQMLLYRSLPLDEAQKAYVIDRAEAFLRGG